MVEHVFLCGLSPEQRRKFPPGTVLSLERGVGKLNLKFDRMRKRLVGHEPKRLTDFIEIASYVFAADRLTSRGPLWDPGVGNEWRRSFFLIIAVRELDFWRQSEVKEALTEALGFLSEDCWSFAFVENLDPIPLQKHLGLKRNDDCSAGASSVVLFSGGLDSLAGAVHELRTTNRHVVLVSHRNIPTVGKRQKDLAAALAEDFPRRVSHVWVDQSLTSKLTREEETQRTRTFFFVAVAAVAAHIEESDRIRFYENGIMSLNFPFATQLVGAKASRSTHPLSLQLLRRLLGLVSAHQIDVDNPFSWKTKVEVVQELASSEQAKLIQGTNSCSRSQFAIKRFQSHCGTCVQCLQRRISTLAGGAGGYDEKEGYATDFLRGPRLDGPDRVMALETINLALECVSISDHDFMSRFAGPSSWVLQAYSPEDRDDAMRETIDLYRRHGVSVRQLLIEATAKGVSEVIDRTLAPESLLALMLASRLPALGHAAIESLPEKLPDPPADEKETPGVAEEIVIAVDERRQRILVRDQAELRGPAIFPLMKLLIEISLDERSKPGLPEDYRSLPAKVLADQLGLTDDEAIRSAIKRARDTLERSAEGLGLLFDRDAVIDSADGGYRLNPKVRIVRPHEI